jgi:pyruvate/2-oxoglutarate dehydrogenase complex dihydrolipoamide dehydrogenase (E3) component
MARDYDLVVIGGTRAGLQAAIAATCQNTRVAPRVALVAPQPIEAESAWAIQALIKFSQGFYSQSAWRADQSLEQKDRALKAWRTQAIAWVNAKVAALKAEYSPAYLTGLGIDLILRAGQFQPRPELHFFADGRMLRSRAYLIASDRESLDAGIPGLSTGDYLTPRTVWPYLQRLLQAGVASRWLIIGDQPLAIELAQTLVRLGEQITVIVPGASLLVQEDPDAVFWLQAHLEAAGISILTQTTIREVKPVAEGWQVMLNPIGKFLIVDQILVCQTENWADVLNLRSIWVRYDQQRVWVNDRLQTSQPQIYVCGDLLGGYTLPQIADWEANFVVDHTLHRSKTSFDYRCLPWSLQTSPVWARVGISEAEARKTYGTRAYMVEQANTTSNQGRSGSDAIEFCKLVVARNGLILGATIFSPSAMGLIQVVGLSIQQRLKVSALAKLAGSPHPCAIVYQTAAQLLSRSS